MLSLHAPAAPIRAPAGEARGAAPRSVVLGLAASLRGVTTCDAGGRRGSSAAGTGTVVSRLFGEGTALAELVPPAGGPAPWAFAVATLTDRLAGGGTLAAIGARGVPSAWSALGAGRVLLIRPGSDRDRLWAIECSLRCPGVAATVAALPANVDPVAARRLKLAADAGGGFGILIRPAAAGREPCWADVRLEVSPAAGPGVRERDTLRLRWHVRALRRRGRTSDELSRGVTLELSDDARLVPVAAGLARAAGPPRPGGGRSDRKSVVQREFARAG